jgi:hypothetical protein
MPEPDYTPYDLLAPADALAAYLATVTGLAGVTAMVARQRDLATGIDQAVAQASGAAILIALEGWSDLVPDGSDCHLDIDYSISLWTMPILRASGSLDESVLLGLLVSAIHRYQPSLTDCQDRWKTSTGRYVPHPKHRIYEFPASYRLTLPAVALTEEEEED